MLAAQHHGAGRQELQFDLRPSEFEPELETALFRKLRTGSVSIPTVELQINTPSHSTA